MQVIRVGGARYHVGDDGPKDGRPLLFLNSLGTDLRVWDEVVARLPSGYRVIRFDKPGHGLSETPAGPYTLDDLVAIAMGILNALNIDKVTVIGLSIGGLIAQGMAAAHPDRCEAMVLMDTAAKIGTTEMWGERIATLRVEGIEAIADNILERWFAPTFFETRGDESALWRSMMSRCDLDGYIGCCEVLASTDMTQSTRALTLPSLVLCGKKDCATPVELVRATADLMGAPFHTIPNAGHLPCVEQPEAVTKLIVKFLKGIHAVD